MTEHPKLELYKETKFKVISELGIKVPEDWEVVKLKEVSTKIVDGTHKTPKYVEKGVPFISTQNLVPFRDYFDFSQYRKFISEEEHKELIKRCKPEKGDLLISKCGTIGRTQVVRVNYEFSIFVGVALVKLIKNKANPDFLEQLFNTDFMLNYLEKVSPGATRKTLTIKALSNVKIPLPPIEEQKTIAEILSTIDKAIEKTQEAIEKTEKLKKGLIQKLLTGEIRIKEKNGKWIFYKETEFQDTEIGRIPKDWKVVRLGDKLKFSNGRRPQDKFEVDNSNLYPLYGANGLYSYTSQYLVEDDYILVVGRVGAAGEIHLAQGKIWVSDNAIYGIAKTRDIFLPYTFYLLKYIDLKKFTKKTTHPIITQAFLRDFKVPLPSLEEQKRIAEVLMTVDKKIELLKKKKELLEKVKKWFMQKLLTGEIRIRTKLF